MFCAVYLHENSAAAESVGLDKLVYSLLKVQDSIADGDVEALPMQKHLMKLLDAAIAETRSADEMALEEFRALVIFGIVGTGSAAVVHALSEMKKPRQRADLAEAVIAYRNRKHKQAIRRFAEIDTARLDGRLVPYVAFANGNLLARSNPEHAVKQFNLTRLAAPGTLLEEASLRRLLSLHMTRANGADFIGIAKQYARRFLKSPYRKQYVEMLQSGIFSMRRKIDLQDIVELGRLMPPKFAAAFHLRLIRRGLVSGHIKMVECSIVELMQLIKKNEVARLEEEQLSLFKILARVTKGDPHKLLKELDALDESRFSLEDKRLLNGAKRILTSILEPIDQSSPPGPAVLEASSQQKIRSETKAGEPSRASSSQSPSEIVAEDKSADEIDDYIDRTRAQLKQVDKILDD